MELQQGYLAEIEKENIPDNQCLCCCKFVIEGWSIRHYSSPKCCAIKIISGVLTVDNFREEVRAAARSMVNSVGGIIFLDCEISGISVISKGTIINQ